MCGIGGLVCRSSYELSCEDIEAMLNNAAHRGPDDRGIVLFSLGRVWTSGSGALPDRGWTAGLGHRRLSIIDLSPDGHQPMADASGRYWIVYNGEVYNYLELRQELKNLGWTFASKTDSEVVLNAYIQWGKDCLHRFNGMWAFAIYDRLTGTIFCARDRFGIKPFYYVGEPGRFAFASEIKQLMTLPWMTKTANRRLLADFFLWGLENHSNESFFSGVKVLPGSHYITITQEYLKIGRIQPVRYWNPAPLELSSEQRTIQEFRELMFDSVRLRLRSDVPVGVTLSGGLDSSSVACVAGEYRRNSGDNTPLSAFNVEYEGVGYSEWLFAEAAARKADARLIMLRPKPECLAADWEHLIWHMEQPFDGLSYFSNFQIYRMIREHGIRVVLSGQGGDELLLGYERYRTYDMLFKLKAMQLLAALSEIIDAQYHANMPLRTQLAYGLYFSMPWLRAIRRRQLVRPILNKEFYREHAGRTEHLLRTTIHNDRQSLQQSELFSYQLPHLLNHEDRVSMAHSVETRLPFLDYRLLELVLGMPTNLLFRYGWSKYILREAMTGVLPEKIQHRTDKMGYETPTRSLIRRNRDIFLPLIRRHKDDPLLNVKAIEKRFDSDHFDERCLCGAVSYLSWKEVFSIS